jgi:hypothetical protein
MMEVSMKQPSLFPDHEDMQCALTLTEHQTCELVQIMSQIVQAFFELTREGDDDDG